MAQDQIREVDDGIVFSGDEHVGPGAQSLLQQLVFDTLSQGLRDRDNSVLGTLAFQVARWRRGKNLVRLCQSRMSKFAIQRIEEACERAGALPVTTWCHSWGNRFSHKACMTMTLGAVVFPVVMRGRIVCG